MFVEIALVMVFIVAIICLTSFFIIMIWFGIFAWKDDVKSVLPIAIFIIIFIIILTLGLLEKEGIL